MAEQRYASTQRRVIDAPRELVWAVVADTNRGDRALGLSAARYRWESGDDGRPVRVATATELGQTLEWIEPPYRWVEGRFVQGRRRFVKGPVDSGFFEARLEDAAAGRTRLEVTAGLTSSSPLRAVLGRAQQLKFRAALARYLDRVDEALRGWRELDVMDSDEPAAERVKRLLGRGYDPVTSGPRTPPDEATLARRGAALRGAPVPRGCAERLLAHLAGCADEEVEQMRPFALARRWALDRREVLRAFLHATRAGLTDLRWQVNCPVCRVGAAILPSLDAVEGQTHCAACQIHFDTDFAQHVEAVFVSNPAVRAVQPALYCASSPAFLPHVLAQLEVGPGQTVEEPVDLPRGDVYARVLGRSGGGAAPVEAGAGVVVRVGDERLRLEPHAEPELVIRNEGTARRVVLLERAGWSADAVLGTVLASFPTFVDLFATEAPRAGVDLRVGHVTLLFSDLVGSTALYEQRGDARAFAVVQAHFRLMARVVRSHGGAIVKTMGDAVMATFASDRDAVRAAREMIERHDEAHPAEEGLGVKIGVCGGPCLAVRANERLDYFGTTVNLAARLQAQAGPGEVVVPEEALAHPDVAETLAGFPRRRFAAELKGLARERQLVGVTVARGAR